MIGLACIAKDENQYFDEWIRHHLKVGFDRIFIYNNNSNKEIIVNSHFVEYVRVIYWKDSEYGSQSRA